MLHTNLFLDTALISRTSGRNLGTFRAVLFRMSGRRWIEERFQFVFQLKTITRGNKGSEYYCVPISNLRTRDWWSVPRSGRFISSRETGSHWVGSWVVRRAGLDSAGEGKNSHASLGNLTVFPTPPARCLVSVLRTTCRRKSIRILLFGV